MVSKSKTVEFEFLNESGQQLLGLKKVLLENKENPLVFNTLVNSILPGNYEKEIYENLVDVNVSSQNFNNLLVQSESFTNVAVIRKKYQALQENISVALERKGVKYFSTDSSPQKGGVLIIRKFGINVDFLRREFRLTEKEAKKLLKDGFMEKYAQLKLNAVTKDMVSIVEKEFRKLYSLRFEISKFYYNENQEVFNIDFIIVINAQHYMEANTQEKSRLYSDLDAVLRFAQKGFYRSVSGSKE